MLVCSFERINLDYDNFNPILIEEKEFENSQSDFEKKNDNKRMPTQK